jgi:glycosyltransferase involved in cell wall biosynthesis
MTTSKLDLSIIVPAYNEAARLPTTLKRFHAYLANKDLSYEIIVVLDGCTDNTREILRGLQGAITNLRILDRSENRGKGYTTRQGMLAATGRIRLFADADNSTDIAHFDQMMPLFDNGYDLVIASRNSNDAPQALQAVPQALYKRFFGRAGNVIVQILAVPGIWDTQCGFKAFRADVAERLFSSVTIEGWGFDIEVLALARALRYRVGIIPANWANDERSHFGSLDYLRVLGETLKIRHNFIMRKYHL